MLFYAAQSWRQVLTGWRRARAHSEGIKLDIIPYINSKSKESFFTMSYELSAMSFIFGYELSAIIVSARAKSSGVLMLKNDLSSGSTLRNWFSGMCLIRLERNAHWIFNLLALR